MTTPETGIECLANTLVKVIRDGFRNLDYRITGDKMPDGTENVAIPLREIAEVVWSWRTGFTI